MDDTLSSTLAGAVEPAGVAPGDRQALFAEAVRSFGAGDLRRTAAVCQQLVAANADDAPAWHLVGCVHGRSGRAAEAARCFGQAVRLAPDNPGYLVNLGSALIDLGRFADAVAALERALGAITAAGDGVHPRVMPDAIHKLVTAHVHAGDSLMDQHRPDAAVTQYRTALKRGGPSAVVHSKLGGAHVFRSDYQTAIDHYREAVRLDPDSIDDAQNLAYVLFREGRVDEAIRVLEDQVRRFPTSPQTAASHCGLGTCYEARGEDDRALQQYQTAVATWPDAPAPLAHACRVLLTRGDADAAEAMLARLVALDSRHHERTGLEGRLHVIRGEMDAARRTLGTAINASRTPVSYFGDYAVACAELGRGDDAVGLLEEAAARQIDPYDRAKLHYHLGALHDRLGNWELAFAAYAEANRYGARTTAFDAAALVRWTTEMISVFSPEGFRRMPRSRQDSRLPVFIVGMPRSGTSLVEQILDSHPEVHGGGELHHVDRLARALPETLGGGGYPRCLADVDADSLDRVAAAHLQTLLALSPEAARISDKMPHNFRHLGLIALLFPKATVVHCVRDPVDTCLSCFFQDFRSGLSFCFDLERLPVYYREYRRLMRHWTDTLGLPVVDVRYEELVADPEPQVRRLVDAVGLPWDDRCLRFFENTRVVATASRQQVRKPVYTRSVGRWKAYERHIGPLLDGLAEFL